jgi:hypothetical protein
MSTNLWRAAVIALSMVVVLLSGYFLNRTGKPYNSAVFNAHKLIALAAAVFVVWTVVRRSMATPLGPGEWIAVVITGLLFLGTGVFGGLVSLDNPMPAAVSRVHQIAPYLTVLSTGGTLYLLLRSAA